MKITQAKETYQNNKNPRNLLTVTEAKDYLHCSVQELYRLIKAGKIPAFQLTRKYLLKQEDLDFFIEAKRYIPVAFSAKIDTTKKDINGELARVDALRGNYAE